MQGRTARGVLWECQEALRAGVWDGCRAVWGRARGGGGGRMCLHAGGRSRYGCLSPTPSPFQAGEWEFVFDSRGPCPQLRVLKAQWAMTKDVRGPQSPGSGTGWVEARAGTARRASVSHRFGVWVDRPDQGITELGCCSLWRTPHLVPGNFSGPWSQWSVSMWGLRDSGRGSCTTASTVQGGWTGVGGLGSSDCW